MQSDKQILFLNSSAGIWSHTATDALLLNRLDSYGVKVSIISCDNYITGLCAVRRSRKRTLEDIAAHPEIDCADCKFTARLTATATRNMRGKGYWLGDFVLEKDRKEAREFVSTWTASGCPEEAQFHGVPIPKLAGYEVSLTYKSWDEATKGPGISEYHRAVEDAALTVLAAKSFFDNNLEFTDLVVRSPHFATNGSFATVARERGLRVIFIDGSPNVSEDYTNLMMWDWTQYSSGNPARDIFRPHLVEVNDLAKGRIDRHFMALEWGASHKVYSPAKGSTDSPLKLLGADLDKPTALLAISSVDEAVSAMKSGVNPLIKYPGSVFEDQHVWVKETVEWFEARPNFQLVVRVHPREFPNRRDGVTSIAGLAWEKQLETLPSNVFLDHPIQRISIYDHFKEVRVLITGWSSVGFEAAMLGVPLVTYDSALPSYPAAIGLTGTSKEEYFANLEKVLTRETDQPFRENALKWAHFLMNTGTTRLGGRFLAARRALMPRWVNLILEGLDRYFFFIYRPLDLWRGILVEPTDGKFKNVILDGHSNFYEIENTAKE